MCMSEVCLQMTNASSKQNGNIKIKGLQKYKMSVYLIGFQINFAGQSGADKIKWLILVATHLCKCLIVWSVSKKQLKGRIEVCILWHKTKDEKQVIET